MHLCNLSLLKEIGDAIAVFRCQSLETKDYLNPTYAQICVEMDFRKAFLV